MRVPVLVISGPPGSGKTTVAWEIFDRLVLGGKCPAFVDIDLLGACWPVEDTDPDNDLVKARNIGAVWANYFQAGSRCLIAAGVIESERILNLYTESVVGAVPVVGRLRARDGELERRILTRGRERGSGIGKLTARAFQLSRELDASDVSNFVVDTDGLNVAAVASAVLSRAGDWPSGLVQG